MSLREGQNLQVSQGVRGAQERRCILVYPACHISFARRFVAREASLEFIIRLFELFACVP